MFVLYVWHGCVNRSMFGVWIGVPREQRGEIWLLLVEQHRLRHNVDELLVTEVEGAEKYEDLLKRLTLHQHAILIDLGTWSSVVLVSQSALSHYKSFTYLLSTYLLTYLCSYTTLLYFFKYDDDC